MTRKYQGNLKVGWRQSVVPSLLSKIKIFVIAAKHYGETDIEIFLSFPFLLISLLFPLNFFWDCTWLGLADILFFVFQRNKLKNITLSLLKCLNCLEYPSSFRVPECPNAIQVPEYLMSSSAQKPWVPKCPLSASKCPSSALRVPFE